MRRAAAIPLLVLFLAACSKEQAVPSPRRVPVILISIDTLRSDRLPAYGYGGVATPAFDALRRDGVLYERAYSHSPLTLPSHVSMMTGKLPNEHGVRNNLGFRLDAAKDRTLARVLAGHGYATGAAVSSYVLRTETGMGEGFDFYDDRVPVTFGGATAEHQRSGGETAALARTWIGANSSRPLFFFLHLYEPHAPYSPPEPFRSRYADPYDGEIAAADAAVGEFIAALKASGVYERAVIILTSDHGEGLWEHGEDQHGIFLYREVLQVPLIVKLPRGRRAGETVSEPFELRRVFDLVLELAGIGPPPKPAAGLYSETLYPRIHLGWSDLRSIISGRYHYIESSRPELYDLAADPGETRNLLDSERRIASALRRELASFPAPDVSLGPVSPEEAAKLAALGYVGSPKARSGPLPNPRDEIGALRDIRSAFELAAKRRNDEAARALRDLLDRNPALTDVATRLAEVLLESGRYEEAVQVYRGAIERSERFSPDLALALAVAYLKASRPAEAEAHARLALDASPVEAGDVVARALMQQGKLAQAEPYVAKVIDRSHRSARALLLLAELQRDRGDLEAALRTLDTIARQSASEYGLEHLRGDVLARMDRPEEAVAAYEREIAKHPQHLQSHANLALIHLILGKRDAADRAFQRMTSANPHRGAYLLAARTCEVAGDVACAKRWQSRAER